MADRSLLDRLARRLRPGGRSDDPPRPPERSWSVPAPGGSIEVVEQGSGDPILIIHGGSGDRTAWSSVADRLARQHRVVRYTRPTYRQSSPARGAEAADVEVSDALAVARAVGEPVLLVGHSSGGVVALEAALADPSPFRGVAVYEPPLDVTHTIAAAAALRRARAAIDAGDPVRAMRIHLRDFVGLPPPMVRVITLLPPTRQLLARHAAGQIADNEMLDALPVGLDRYAALHRPVLLITGEKSPGHLRERSAGLAAVLPDVGGQVELAGQSHGANTGDPAAVAAAIEAFARRLAG